MFDETEKRFDRRQSRIAGTNGIGTSFFDMFAERADRLNVDVFDEKVRWCSLEPSGDKPQKEGERSGLPRRLARLSRRQAYASTNAL